ncbi:MAG: hypothetical protein FD180_3197 [Planctomycetota bacterium]|nr:MAG: hypothetical protein FD180_3197 [Planctomycetota bacterium]
MRRLFRSFERFGVDYLLISGQASVLYGAATFSEDVDLWVAPASANIPRLKRALASLGATWFKLTPPLTRRNMLAGHGFHFIVPSRPLPIYLDILGHPPRVGGFGVARAGAREVRCDWGRIPVVSIEDLVEMKKTQRPSDYETITNLAQIRVDESPGVRRVLSWAARNAFRAEARAQTLALLGKTVSVAACGRQIGREMARLQRTDIAYWRLRRHALRRLYREGKLQALGELVQP